LIPSASQLLRLTAQFLFRREDALLSFFLVTPSRWIFDVPRETIENVKSFLQAARQRKKSIFA
jgi:hypothetical protein